MAVQRFYLAGQGAATAIEVDVSTASDLESLKLLVAGHFAIVQPEGIDFQTGDVALSDFEAVVSNDGPISVTIDGHTAREVPGAKGLPLFGNYFEIFPDHLGNHQRLFDRYGPIFQETNMGRTVYQINDPGLADIIFAESDFFTKNINQNHPLYPLKDQTAGVFLSDTSNPNWKIVHKFLPPAFGPKAVRHYAPTMNGTIDTAIPVFDKLEEAAEAWNAYQYMLKLGSQAIGELVLGMDFHQFDGIDSPMHEMVQSIALGLTLNKKIASQGDWYANLPFGDPKRLRDLQKYQRHKIEESINNAASNGTEELPLQEAALHAANVIDYLIRATDTSGQKLPTENLISAVIVAAGAGFVTTSTLLSWLLYGLVSYPGMQERLLQELVDNGFSDDTEVTPELISKLTFQDNYVKEMQRLHNPSYQPGRTAKVDLILPGGYKIPEGSVIIGAIHHIHNNPKYWDNPSKFDPDRWNTDKVKNLPRSAYIPFAMGQRSCIGFNFALQEVKIFLPKLVWRYAWHKEGETATEYDPFFQLIRPVNLYVRTTKRTQWPSKSGEMQS